MGTGVKDAGRLCAPPAGGAEQLQREEQGYFQAGRRSPPWRLMPSKAAVL
jgi:hypothetical protein